MMTQKQFARLGGLAKKKKYGSAVYREMQRKGAATKRLKRESQPGRANLVLDNDS